MSNFNIKRYEYIFSIMVVLGFGLLLYSSIEKSNSVKKYKESKVESRNLLEDEKNTVSVFHQRVPYVVFVHNLAYVSDFFSSSLEAVQSGTG